METELIGGGGEVEETHIGNRDDTDECFDMLNTIFDEGQSIVCMPLSGQAPAVSFIRNPHLIQTLSWCCQTSPKGLQASVSQKTQRTSFWKKIESFGDIHKFNLCA